MANDYTAVIDNDLALKGLLDADFTFNKTFSVLLAKNDLFEAKRILRIMPRRRLVAYGLRGGQQVVAKFFLDPKTAKQQLEKELAGIAVLKHNRIPTPTVIYHGNLNYVTVIVFEYITDSQSLQDWWMETKDESSQSILFSCMVELATHHVLGVVQRDLHLKNFLIKEKQLYTIDGADITQESPLLPRKKSIKYIALFLSQLGIGYEALQEKLFKHYAKSRGWLLKPDDITLLFMQIKRWNAIRWEKYSKKIFRSSTDFSVFRQNGFHGIYRRDYGDREFLEILKNPDAAFNDPRAELLKDGRSATVIKFNLNGKTLIIKRHNMKHLLHRIRRYVRTTRALKVWRVTNKLDLFTIPVAKPIAFLEKKFMGLHSYSYYISEALDGISLGEYIDQYRDDEDQIAKVAKRVIELMKNIVKLKIAHGDLKETNVLLNRKGEPILIDYDTANEHISLTRLKQAWNRDVRRLLRNFNNEPVVTKKFKEAL